MTIFFWPVGQDLFSRLEAHPSLGSQVCIRAAAMATAQFTDRHLQGYDSANEEHDRERQHGIPRQTRASHRPLQDATELDQIILLLFKALPYIMEYTRPTSSLVRSRPRLPRRQRRQLHSSIPTLNHRSSDQTQIRHCRA
jgi:hypothetical protein